MQRRLIIGATSAIAEAVARRFAEAGDALYLVARDGEHLARIAADLATRGAARIEQAVLDVTDRDALVPVIGGAFSEMDGIDSVLIAHGSGGNEKETLASIDALRREFEINGTATITLMALVTQHMKAQGHGHIAVLSSVAGDRGRARNMLYGAVKAAVDTYASGLRQHLQEHNVTVLTVKPGWVDTPMTAGMKKNALFATPDRVARDIVHAIAKRRSVLYTPWYWRPVMTRLGLIPEVLWRHLKI